MIKNLKDIRSKKFKCNKWVMRYLVYECNLPVLGFDKDSYYFYDNELLQEHLAKMPLWIKLLSGL